MSGVSGTIDYTQEPILVEGGVSFKDIDDAVSQPMETRPPWKFYVAFCFPLTALLIGGIFLGLSFYWGMGLWGNNNPVAWGFPIINFVFWVGIGHAGTLISAVLFLFRQKWRTGIARFAEAMTIFAVITAVVFPLIHTGRPWLALVYLLPYPNQHGIWVNFSSPLMWDLFALSTYGSVSFVFWYVGLIPDFAVMRDRTTSPLKRTIFGILSMGWRHSNVHWLHYEKVYMILAGLATPLVLSVHTIVSFDFAVSILPGWHTTIFGPYFVTGAVFSGFAMVMTVLLIVRYVFDLQHIITMSHLDKMAKILITTGLIVGYAYGMEFFIAWYSGVSSEAFVFLNRALGPYAWAYWIMVSCNVISPQIFWFKRLRHSIPVMFVVSIFINIGMWFERFVIVVTSLSRDFLPSSWGYFRPTITDFGILLGSFGLFFTLVFIFARTLPVIAMSEVKGVMPGAQPSHHGEG